MYLIQWVRHSWVTTYLYAYKNTTPEVLRIFNPFVRRVNLDSNQSHIEKLNCIWSMAIQKNFESIVDRENYQYRGIA